MNAMKKLALCATVMVLSVGASAAERIRNLASPAPYVSHLILTGSGPLAGSGSTPKLWVNTAGGGVHRSTDGGTTWTAASLPLPSGGTEVRTSQLASPGAFPATPTIRRLWAATDSGMYLSDDDGVTYIQANGTGMGALPCRYAGFSTGYITGSTNVQFVMLSCEDSGNTSGVYVTADSGANWAKYGTGLENDTFANFNFCGDKVYAVTSRRGIYTTTLGTLANPTSIAAWTALNTGFDTNASGDSTMRVIDLQFMNCPALGVPTVGTEIMVAMQRGSGAYRKLISDATWVANNAGLPVAGKGKIASSASYYTTANVGASRAGYYIYLDGYGIYKADPFAATLSWTLVNSTLANTLSRTSSIRMTKELSGTVALYMGTSDGLKRSVDDGATWSDFGTLPNNGRMSGFWYDNFNRNEMLVVGDRMYRASVSGLMNDPVNYNAPTADTGITGTLFRGFVTSNPNTQGEWFATTPNNGLFKTTNGGTSWNAINNGLPPMEGESAAVTRDSVAVNTHYKPFSNGNKGVYKTTDGGANWVAMNTGLTGEALRVSRIAADPATSGVLYAATKNGLYKYNGTTWNAVFQQPDGFGGNEWVNVVRIDPNNANNIVIGNWHTTSLDAVQSTSGVWLSTNGGTSFTQILASKRIADLRLFSQGAGNPPVIYAALNTGATDQGWVVKSINNGTTWTNIDNTNIVAGGLAAAPTSITQRGVVNLIPKGNELGGWTMPGHTYFVTNKSVHNDVGDNFRSDIIWKSATADIAIWQMTNATINQGTALGNYAGLTLQAVGDSDGDGKADLFMRGDAFGSLFGYKLNGSTITAASLIEVVGTDVQIVGSGDFNGDGKADLLLRHTNGTFIVWIMNGLTVQAAGILGTLNSDWSLGGIGDLDGNGRDDIVLRYGPTGLIVGWGMDAAGTAIATAAAIEPLNATDYPIVGIGDTDGDGKADIILKYVPNGAIIVFKMNGFAIASAAIAGTNAATVAAIGDYDGDGKADILFRDGSGNNTIWLMNGATVKSSTATNGLVGNWTALK